MGDTNMTEEENLSMLWEIAKGVASANVTATAYLEPCETYCIFCDGKIDYQISNDFEHMPDCIALKARALVEQKKEG